MEDEAMQAAMEMFPDPDDYVLRGGFVKGWEARARNPQLRDAFLAGWEAGPEPTPTRPQVVGNKSGQKRA